MGSDISMVGSGVSGFGPRSERDEAYGSSILKFLRNIQTDFQIDCINLHPTNS